MRFGNNKLNRILAVALCAATLTGGFLPTVSIARCGKAGVTISIISGPIPSIRLDIQRLRKKIIKTVSRTGRCRISTGMNRINIRSSSERNMSSVSVRSRKSIVRRK